ncbi:S24 family peptidase [Streptococcus hyovaginalis]|uniref:S24 family peptidase n=1 Tax=Streptococcus hyovaginalis TaxID=149015 RepID=UPI003BF92289
MTDKELAIYIGSKIREYRKKRFLTQNELALSVGIGHTTIANYEKGFRTPKKNTLFKIAESLNVTIDDLFPPVQKEDTLSSPTPQVLHLDRKLQEPRHAEWISQGERLLEEQEAESATINEPLYEYKVFEKLAAGNGYTYFNDGNFDIVFHDEKMDHDFASWVFGDSMEPTYLNGEVVLIKQTGFDYDGAIYAVDWDGQTYIKKVYKEETGLRLVSLNKKYADKFAPYDEDPRIIGKIVGHFQPMTT